MRCLTIFGVLSISLFGCTPANPVATNSGAADANSTTPSASSTTVAPATEGEPGGETTGPLATAEDSEQSSEAAVEPPSTEDEPNEGVLTFDSIDLTTLPAELAPRPAWTTSRVEGSPDPPLPYTVEEAFDGLSFYAPVVIQQIPGTQQYLFGELCGRVYSIDMTAPDAEPALVIDLFQDVPNRPPAPARDQPPITTDNPLPGEHLYDLTFHPDFELNRYVYLTYLPPEDESLCWLTRMELSADDPPQLLRDTETRFLSWHATGHNGGCVRFGPDGYLYISTGDGVGPNPPDSNDVGQDITNMCSSVLRIDVDNTEGDQPYVVPSDNPFVDIPDARPEVWAFGFRNPWKMDFDLASGNLWVGDVGWETWEMVHYVSGGGNYGWPIMEGRKQLRSEIEQGPAPITPPVKDYPRNEACSVTGGIVCSGQKYPELAGWFIHGDFRTGHIWAIKLDDQGEPQHRHLARSSIAIIAFMETAEGEILVMDHDMTGRTYRLVPSPPASEAPEFPQDLAATGLFSSVADLQPAPGVIPYDVTAEPWMDGAFAERLLALPDHSQITATEVDGNQQWAFPEGAVLAQTVSHRAHPEQDPVRLETRLLHFEEDSWRAYSYRWNDEQTNATLVSPAGEQLALPQGAAEPDVPIHETWQIASRTECVFCHRDKVGTVLGFVPSQLDRSVDHDGTPRNQLELLTTLGVFDGDPQAAIDESAGLVDPHDPAQDLTERARSYLDVNCGICHNRHGESISMFYLRRHYSLEDAKAFNKPGIGTFGIVDPYLIAPGDPYRSMVLYRLAKLGNARMPYIASRAIDPAGFLLIHDWIASMEGDISSLSGDDRTSLDLLGQGDAPAEQRLGAISQLLSTTSGAFALLSVVRSGGLAAELQDQIVDLSQQSSAPTVRSLYEDYVPESLRRPTLGPNIQPETILELTGDAGRGRLIYLSDGSRCRTCHVKDEQGRSLGADLREIGKKYPKPELLRHILEPSLKMEPAVTPYLIETADGQVHSGLIVERNDEEIVLHNAQLQVVRIPTSSVESESTLDKSIMPERLLSDMTAQEAADLLEYLSSLRGGEEEE